MVKKTLNTFYTNKKYCNTSIIFILFFSFILITFVISDTKASKGVDNNIINIHAP